MSEQLSAISDSGASGGSTTPSSFEEATKQPEHLSVSRLDDTKAEVKWPDDTDHDLIERQVAKGTHGGPRMVMAPLGNFRFKGQPYDLLVGFLVKGVMHIWRLHREVVYPRCYAIKFHGKQELQRKYANGLSRFSTAPVTIVVVIPNTWAPLGSKHLDHMFRSMYRDTAPNVAISPNFSLQDCLTCVKLSHWLNDSLFRAYERAMGAFLNERLAAWLTSYPAASPGQKCSSDDVASVFSRLAAKPWYREMPFGVCVDELRSLLEEKHHLLLQDPAWARRVKQVSELGAFMGMDLIEL